MKKLEKILYKELFSKSFYEFVKYFWHTVEPNKFIDGNIIKIYCETFQYMCKPWIGYKEIDIKLPKISENINIIDIRNNKNKLCINVPPRHTKTLIFSILGPVWIWTYYPIKAVSVSHTQGLSVDINSKRKMIVNSLEYKEIYDDIILITDSKSNVKDTKGGELYAINRNALTGYGCEFACLDDLTNAETARKDKEEMNNAWNFYRNTMPSRFNDINKCCILNIQQRLAPNDITGHILNDTKLADQYNFIVLPAKFLKETYIICPISGDIIHYNKGDYLWPERFGNYESLKYQVGATVWETQYMQNPIATDKTIIKENMIIEKDLPDTPDIENADMIYASHDFPVGDKEKNDNLGSLLAYKYRSNIYIVDCLEAKMAFKKSVNYVKALEDSYPGVIQIIEEKANGAPILEQLQDEVAGMVAFQPGTDSKIQRLDMSSLYIGNVIFVKTVFNKFTNKWEFSENLKNLINRLLVFPMCEHDDIVDAFSMLLLFVFKDKRYQVYGRAFDDMNIIDSKKIDKLQYSAIFFNKEGDIWKLNEIAIKYGEHTQIIVKREERFKASVEEGLQKLKEFSPKSNLFIDCSATDGMKGMISKDISIEKYTLEDFDLSVTQTNLAFSKKSILLDKECRLTKSDIENFKFNKTKDDTAKYVTTKDGFVSNIRTALHYFGGII